MDQITLGDLLFARRSAAGGAQGDYAGAAGQAFYPTAAAGVAGFAPPSETRVYNGWLGNDRDALIRATGTFSGMQSTLPSVSVKQASPGVMLGTGPIDLSLERDLTRVKTPDGPMRDAQTRYGVALTQPVGEGSVQAGFQRTPSTLANLFTLGASMPLGSADDNLRGDVSAMFQRATSPDAKPDTRFGVMWRSPF